MILLHKCINVLDAVFPGKARLTLLVIIAKKIGKSPSRQDDVGHQATVKGCTLIASPGLQVGTPPPVLSVPQQLLGASFLFLRLFCCSENGGELHQELKS